MIFNRDNETGIKKFLEEQAIFALFYIGHPIYLANSLITPHHFAKKEIITDMKKIGEFYGHEKKHHIEYISTCPGAKTHNYC